MEEHNIQYKKSAFLLILIRTVKCRNIKLLNEMEIFEDILMNKLVLELLLMLCYWCLCSFFIFIFLLPLSMLFMLIKIKKF